MIPTRPAPSPPRAAVALATNLGEECLRVEVRAQLRHEGKHRGPFARLEAAGLHLVARPVIAGERHFCDCLK